MDGYRIEGRPIALTEGAEIENRDAVIAAELRFGGEVAESPAGAFTPFGAAVSAEAEPSDVLTIDRANGTVNARVTPGAETVWLVFTQRSPVIWRVEDAHLERDTDGDGNIQCESRYGFLPPLTRVVVVDLSSGETHTAHLAPRPFSATFLRDTNGDFSWAEVQWPVLESSRTALWVRPGVGAWRGSLLWYLRPQSPPGFDTFLGPLSAAVPVGPSPAAPAAVEPGDYFVGVSIAAQGNGTFFAGHVDEALEQAQHADTEVVLSGSSMDERLGNAVFVVTRYRSTDRDTRIGYEISDADPNDGVDYPPADGVLVIRRGEVFGRIDYPIPQDRDYTGGTKVRVGSEKRHRRHPRWSLVQRGDPEG